MYVLKCFLLFAVFFFITPLETALSTLLTAAEYAAFIVSLSLEFKDSSNFFKEVFTEVFTAAFLAAFTFATYTLFFADLIFGKLFTP